MAASGLFRTISNVSGIIRELEAMGMRVEIGDDFSEYHLLRDSQIDRTKMFPVFDGSSSFIDYTNGFWVCGFNETNELMHTQAVRRFDLSEMNLGRHFDIHRHKDITPDTTPDPDLTFYRGPEALRTITGNVCYHGDFWLHARGLGGPRSVIGTALLSRLLFEVVYRLWEPDFVTGLVPKKLATKGLHMRYGYTHCEPGQWIGPDGQVTDEDHLVSITASELSSSIRNSIPSLPSRTREATPARQEQQTRSRSEMGQVALTKN